MLLRRRRTTGSRRSAAAAGAGEEGIATGAVASWRGTTVVVQGRPRRPLRSADSGEDSGEDARARGLVVVLRPGAEVGEEEEADEAGTGRGSGGRRRWGGAAAAPDRFVVPSSELRPLLVSPPLRGAAAAAGTITGDEEDPLLWRHDPRRGHVVRRRSDGALGIVIPFWHRLVVRGRTDFLIISWPRGRPQTADPTRDWRPDLWTLEEETGDLLFPASAAAAASASAVPRLVEVEDVEEKEVVAAGTGGGAIVGAARTPSSAATPRGEEEEEEEGDRHHPPRRRRLCPPPAGTAETAGVMECPVCFSELRFGGGEGGGRRGGGGGGRGKEAPAPAVVRVPCGHIECETCVLRIAETAPAALGRCPQCRAATREYVRPFVTTTAVAAAATCC